MSLRSRIEAVIYAAEEPVTLQQLSTLLGEEVRAEIDRETALQAHLPLAPDGSEDTQVEVNGALEDNPSAAPEIPIAEAEEPPSSDTGAQDAALTPDADKRLQRENERTVRDYLRRTVDALIAEYSTTDRGIEIREVAGGYRMATKPEYHDAVRGFIRSLKPPFRLTLQALETLAVIAYKQPVTAAEVAEIRGVDSAGVLGGLIGRKLIATAGRKQVIGRPMLYKTTKEFLVRFGLKDLGELPSMEEFERMASELNEQEDLPIESVGAIVERANARGDAEHLREIIGTEQEPA